MWESRTAIATWQGFGAETRVVPRPEMYLAFKQGIIEGGPETIGIAVDQKNVEVAKHWTRTDEYFQIINILVNGRKWQSLTDAQRNILRQAAKEAGETFRKESEQRVHRKASARRKGVRRDGLRARSGAVAHNGAEDHRGAGGRRHNSEGASGARDADDRVLILPQHGRHLNERDGPRRHAGRAGRAPACLSRPQSAHRHCRLVRHVRLDGCDQRDGDRRAAPSSRSASAGFRRCRSSRRCGSTFSPMR